MAKKMTILDKQLLGYLEAAARTRRPKNSPYLTTPSKPVKLRLAAKYHMHMQMSHAHAHVTCCTCACICACACIRTNAPGPVSQARCPRAPRPTPRTPRLNAPTPTWRPQPASLCPTSYNRVADEALGPSPPRAILACTLCSGSESM